MNADEVVKALRDWNEQYLSVMCASDCAPQCYEYCDGVDCIAVRAADCIESLQAQLAAEKRRADAAVEDMKVGWLCRACIKRVKGKEWCNCPAVNFVNGPEKTTTCENFEWRGPQEAEKGEAAVEDMKRIVDKVRETHCDDTCCFACKYDADFSITEAGDFANECPGFDTNECFEWRGVKEERE